MDPVARFSSAARAFCAFCAEGPGRSDDLERLRRLQQLLADVYAAGLRLPGVPFEDAPEPPSPDAADREALARRLEQLPFQYYWDVEPSPEVDDTPGPVLGDLYDDLLDLHADLSAGEWLCEQGYLRAGVQHWREMFFHWGEHALGALRALRAHET